MLISAVSSEENLDISVEALQETESLLKNFVHGIPCRSALLSTDFKDHPMIKTFHTEIMTSFCKVKFNAILAKYYSNLGRIFKFVI